MPENSRIQLLSKKNSATMLRKISELLCNKWTTETSDSKISAADARCLGSARVPRTGDRVPRSRTFLCFCAGEWSAAIQDFFGETPKPARETRALPRSAERSIQLTL